MRILVVHNFYQQPGGEDVVFANETDLLRQNGHEVIEFTAHNDQVEEMGRVKLAINTVWSSDYKHQLSQVIGRHEPDIAHFHNTFMVVSPSAYYACRDAGVPIVQTLHNYRLYCLNSSFFRDNHICEDCVGKPVPFPGIQHGCYHDSRVASGVVAAMVATHRARGTYSKVIDRYIVLTDFARQKFAEIGLPQDKLVVKTNFLKDDPGVGTHRGDYALFVGRLTDEKGVYTLIDAWRELPDIRLKIVGDGPALPTLTALIAQHGLTHVELLGRQSHEETLAIMRDARALIFPSLWYEGMPMTIIEAFACGVPVIASDLGSMAAVVEHGRTGLHFEAGNPGDLAARVREWWQPPERMAALRTAARQEFEAKYTAAENYERLMDIYVGVQEEHAARSG